MFKQRPVLNCQLKLYFVFTPQFPLRFWLGQAAKPLSQDGTPNHYDFYLGTGGSTGRTPGVAVFELPTAKGQTRRGSKPLGVPLGGGEATARFSLDAEIGEIDQNHTRIVDGIMGL